MRRILIVNPWITDVAAFDLWAWPLGLLYWAARLRSWGFTVDLIDCTDRSHPALEGKAPSSRRFHTGKYLAHLYDFQPEPARHARRRFRRYGLAVDAFARELEESEWRLGGSPDAILVTSRMTYWYHGVKDAIARCRQRWSSTPIVLGGVYATLCPDHARANSGADFVLEGDGYESLPAWLSERFPGKAPKIAPLDSNPETWPSPAFDLCHNRAALPLMTSIGCPFRCSYCASPILSNRLFRHRSPESTARELLDCHDRWGTSDFVFYDDALLIQSEESFEPFLDLVIESGVQVRFHVPNGLHYARIEPRIARKMRSAGFETIRLGFETSRCESLEAWGRKGDNRSFAEAVTALREAGFDGAQIGAYIMAGLPGQTAQEVRDSIDAVWRAGANPYLNEFSPIPGTEEWKRALEISGDEIAREPLWHNNSLYRTRRETCLREELPYLKSYAVARRRKLGASV